MYGIIFYRDTKILANAPVELKAAGFGDMMAKYMLASDILDSSKTFVELLVKEFNPKCKIEPSALSNLIR